MRIIGLALGIALAVAGASNAAEYRFDPGHTEVRFYWDHAGFSEQSGEWGTVTGTVEFDPENIEATTISVTIDPASINTGFRALDDDLRSERFFDVANHPEITFVSTGVEKTGLKIARVTGNLTIKGITQPLVLDVELVHYGEHPIGQFFDRYKGTWMGIRATGTLLRSKFGVGFGAPITSDQIRLEIQSEMGPS